MWWDYLVKISCVPSFSDLCIGSLRVLVLPAQVLQVSWKPSEDAGQSAIEYIVNTTTTGMEFANSTSIKHPITSVPISGHPQYSAGTVLVWARNPGAMSKLVTLRFRMVKIVTDGKLMYIRNWLYLGILAALCSLSNGLLYVYGHSNCIFWPALVSTNYDAACISIHFTAKA